MFSARYKLLRILYVAICFGSTILFTHWSVIVCPICFSALYIHPSDPIKRVQSDTSISEYYEYIYTLHGSRDLKESPPSHYQQKLTFKEILGIVPRIGL